MACSHRKLCSTIRWWPGISFHLALEIPVPGRHYWRAGARCVGGRLVIHGDAACCPCCGCRWRATIDSIELLSCNLHPIRACRHWVTICQAADHVLNTTTASCEHDLRIEGPGSVRFLGRNQDMIPPTRCLLQCPRHRLGKVGPERQASLCGVGGMGGFSRVRGPARCRDPSSERAPRVSPPGRLPAPEGPQPGRPGKGG